MILLIYYSAVIGLRLWTKTSGWSKTNVGRIFKAKSEVLEIALNDSN